MSNKGSRRFVLRGMPLLAIVMLLALVAGACQQGAGPGQDGERRVVRLAYVAAQTGPYTPLTIHGIRAAELAIEEANLEDEVEGVRIILQVFDTQASPDQASVLKDAFIPDDSFIGVIGGAFSGETRAILPSLQEAGLVAVSPSATNVQLPVVPCLADDANATECPDQTVFHRVVPDDDVQAAGLTDYVTKVLKFNRMAFAHDNTDYGKGVAEGTRDLLKEAGVQETTTVAIDPASQDYSAAVNTIRGTNPQAVFYGGYSPEAGRLAKQLKDAGFQGQFISGDGSLDPDFVTNAGGAGAEGAILTCSCTLATEDSEGEAGEFAKKFKQKFGYSPGVYAVQGYDAARIFIDGMKEGHLTRSAMHDYVEGLTTVEGTIAENIEFEPNGNMKGGEVFVHKVEDGRITVLGTVTELAG